MAHYVDVDKFGGIGAILVIGEDEGAVEEASIDAGVIEGDVEDVNWAVLHILSFFTAVPGQAVSEVVIHYIACHVGITVDLLEEKKNETAMANNQSERHNIWFSTQKQAFCYSLIFCVYK